MKLKMLAVAALALFASAAFGQASFQNQDYNLSFTGTQDNCGGCGNTVTITGTQEQ